MIVPMAKIFCAVAATDQSALLTALGTLGVIHLQAVDPSEAQADAELQRNLASCDKAVALLSGLEATPSSPPPADPLTVAHDIINLAQHEHENQQRLRNLHAQRDDLGPWGTVVLDDLARLDAAGAVVSLYLVPRDQVDMVSAPVCLRMPWADKKRALMLVIERPQQAAQLPEDSEAIPRPERDAASLEAEITRLDNEMKTIAQRRAELATHRPALQATRESLDARVRWQTAERSGLADDALFAVQGWIPAENCAALADDLAAAGLSVAVDSRPPQDDEQPPTLVRYPRWAQPIKGLFDMMGTVVGYREVDVSPAFIIALPLFAAILIGDAGYGLLLTLLLVGMRGKVIAAMGLPFANLGLIIGLATIAWGLVTNGFFGFQPFGPDAALIEVSLREASRQRMMELSFWIAAIHLSFAWAWQALRLYPDLRFLAPLGWALVVWGMLGVVFYLLLGPEAYGFSWATPWPWLLIVGTTLGVVFHGTQRNPLVRIGAGVGNGLLELLGKFSDEISYVRLMAVGLASTVLAQNFNQMAGLGPEGSGFGALTPVILVLGHLLNFALCMIALFAHGVRLNMLEFSNNLGMQWSGYAYQPFRHNA